MPYPHETARNPFVSTGPLIPFANPLLNTGPWVHVAVTVQGGGQGIFYIDGAQAGTFTPSAGTVNNNLPLWIGEPLVPGRPREIAIDDLEMFNRALTPQEVQAIYNAGSVGKCKQSVILALTPSNPTTNTLSVTYAVNGCFTRETFLVLNAPAMGIPWAYLDTSGAWVPLPTPPLADHAVTVQRSGRWPLHPVLRQCAAGVVRPVSGVRLRTERPPRYRRDPQREWGLRRPAERDRAVIRPASDALSHAGDACLHEARSVNDPPGDYLTGGLVAVVRVTRLAGAGSSAAPGAVDPSR